jgi:hypothetical protein
VPLIKQKRQYLRFLIETSGSVRRVFSANAKGTTLTVAHPASLVARHLTRPDGLVRPVNYHNAPIQEQRYSIHSTPKSKDINEIVAHAVLKDGRDLKRTLRTFAIKKTAKFAFVFGRCFPDLTFPSFDYSPKPGETVINLGQYDPAKFTMFAALFVSAAAREFVYFEQPRTFNINQQVIADYRLVWLWCFIRLPSTPDGASFSNIHEGEFGRLAVHPGFDEAQCINFFNEAREGLREEAFKSFDLHWRLQHRGLLTPQQYGHHLIYLLAGHD